MPLAPHRAGIAAAIALLIALSPIASAGENCELQGGREIGDGNNSVLIATHSAFDPYRYVMVDTVYLDGSHLSQLSNYQQARLRTTFKQAIEHDWQERLGWQSSKRAGHHVLRLNIHINDIVVDGSTTMMLDASLSDSLTGVPLMTQCNETLNVSPQVAALDSGDSRFWNQLQNSVRHWGAGLGSHIMTPY